MKKLVVALISITILSGCSGDRWFGSKKELNMPGERISLIANMSDQGEYGDFSTLPDTASLDTQTLYNDCWNGGFNKLTSSSSNLYWSGPGRFSKWTYGPSSTIANPSIPCIEGDVIFMLSPTGSVIAYNAIEEQELWRNDFFTANGGSKSARFFTDFFYSGGITKNQNVLYVTAGTNSVVAIDSASGRTLWSSNLASPVRAFPIPIDDLLIVQGIDNKLYALDALSGKVVWNQVIGFGSLSSLTIASGVAVKDSVILKSTDDTLVAIATGNGEELWYNELTKSRGSGFTITSSSKPELISTDSLFLMGKRLIATNSSGTIFAVDVETGESLWERDVNSNGKLMCSEHLIYTITKDHHLLVMSETGYIASKTHLVMQDKNGNPPEKTILSTPMLLNGLLYVSDNNGHLFKIDTFGKVLDVMSIPQDIYIGFVVANGKMFLISGNAVLYIQSENGKFSMQSIKHEIVNNYLRIVK